MKRITKLFALLLVISAIVLSSVSCELSSLAGLLGGDNGGEHIDYAKELKLDMNSSTLKQEVTVKLFIDGDTTHFYVPTSISPSGYLKARYLAVNTPESTGKIEPFGKVASRFTRAALESAESIIIESDDDKWNIDSTGDRYLLWIWYKPAGESEYKNLNLELLQNGLAIASNSSQNRYGAFCVGAIDQAKNEKLYVYSEEKDPEMYDGDIIELTLKELRTNMEEYDGKDVMFTGVITQEDNNSVFVESYDTETEMYYGMQVYYGFNLSAQGSEILSVGNECRVVGRFAYTEIISGYQVTNVKYNIMKPNDPYNLQLISEGKGASYVPTDVNTFVNGKETVTVYGFDENGEETAEQKEFSYAELVLHTTISMSNLKIKEVYTTDNEGSDSNGAMTITCEAADGTEVKVRTVVLRDENDELLTYEDFPVGSYINAKGIVDLFNGSYQLKVLSHLHIEVVPAS